jgi:transposase
VDSVLNLSGVVFELPVEVFTMTAPVAVAHPTLALDDLRARERGETRTRIARRLQAVRMALEDEFSREQIGRAARLHVNRVAFWIHRFNQHGFEGLEDLPRGAPPSLLTEAQKAEVLSWVRKGADPKRDGFARWTGRRLVKRIRERFGVKASVDAVYSWLWANKARHRKARKVPSKADPQALAAWGKKDGRGQSRR